MDHALNNIAALFGKSFDTIEPHLQTALFHEDRCGLSSLASERFGYCAAEVTGHCLDVGCGYGNRFVKEYLNGNGRGIDLFPYEG